MGKTYRNINSSERSNRRNNSATNHVVRKYRCHNRRENEVSTESDSWNHGNSYRKADFGWRGECGHGGSFIRRPIEYTHNQSARKRGAIKREREFSSDAMRDISQDWRREQESVFADSEIAPSLNEIREEREHDKYYNGHFSQQVLDEHDEYLRELDARNHSAYQDQQRKRALSTYTYTQECVFRGDGNCLVRVINGEYIVVTSEWATSNQNELDNMLWKGWVTPDQIDNIWAMNAIGYLTHVVVPIDNETDDIKGRFRDYY